MIKVTIFIPASIRELLDKGNPDQIKSVLFVRGQTKCLWLYSLQDWEHKLARLRATLDDDKSRLFMHFIVAETTASEIDSSGRICVPRRLREVAGIDDEIIISTYERLETWSLEEGNSSLACTDWYSFGILLEFDGRANAEDFLTQRGDQRSANGPIWHNLIAVLSLPRPLLPHIEPLFGEVLDP